MSLVTIKDITFIMRSFTWNGVDICAPEDGKIIKNPVRFFVPLIGIGFWSVALANFTLAYYKDVDKLVAVMAVNVQLYLSVIKLFLFVARGRRYIRLINSLEQLALQGNDLEREAWNTETRRVKTIAASYGTACWTTGVIAMVAPLIRLLIIYMKTGEIVITLPLPGIFPYDTNKIHYFILTNIWTMQLIYLAINAIVSVDSLFGWYVFNIAAHLHIMRLKLEHTIHEFYAQPAEVFRKDFAAFIEYHRKIILMASEFNDVFAQIIFAEVLFSCLQICFLAYQLAYSSDPESLPFVCTLMASIIIQLMIYCFGGEKMKSESDAICDNIYLLTPWQNLPPRVQRQFLLPLMRTQRVMTLTGYFFTADRNMLVWIFRTAGSFIALLSAINEKQ